MQLVWVMQAIAKHVYANGPKLLEGSGGSSPRKILGHWASGECFSCNFEVSTRYSPWVITCKILSIYSVPAYTSIIVAS